MKENEIRIYQTATGKRPFMDWINGLKDISGKALIYRRIERAAEGNPGKVRRLSQGVWEMKIPYGPGYSVYYGKDGETIVILLTGGDKSGQAKDIKKAREYWRDYLDRS